MPPMGTSWSCCPASGCRARGDAEFSRADVQRGSARGSRESAWRGRSRHKCALLICSRRVRKGEWAPVWQARPVDPSV
eukprot:7384369-Prymnesium_polylepis.1